MDIHRGFGILLWLFTRKVRRGILLGNLYLNVRPDLGELLQGLLVTLIGKMPQYRADGVGIVVDRHRGGAESGEVEVSANLACVIQRIITDAQIDVQLTPAIIRAGLQTPEFAADRYIVGFRDFVAM